MDNDDEEDLQIKYNLTSRIFGYTDFQKKYELLVINGTEKRHQI